MSTPIKPQKSEGHYDITEVEVKFKNGNIEYWNDFNYWQNKKGEECLTITDPNGIEYHSLQDLEKSGIKEIQILTTLDEIIQWNKETQNA